MYVEKVGVDRNGDEKEVIYKDFVLTRLKIDLLHSSFTLLLADTFALPLPAHLSFLFPSSTTSLHLRSGKGDSFKIFRYFTLFCALVLNTFCSCTTLT